MSSLRNGGSPLLSTLILDEGDLWFESLILVIPKSTIGQHFKYNNFVFVLLRYDRPFLSSKSRCPTYKYITGNSSYKKLTIFRLFCNIFHLYLPYVIYLKIILMIKLIFSLHCILYSMWTKAKWNFGLYFNIHVLKTKIFTPHLNGKWLIYSEWIN